MVKQPFMLALPRPAIHGGGLVLLFFTTFLFSQQNFNLYHAVVELFCILVAWFIFSAAYITHHYSNNNYFIFFGIAYLFVGGLDFLHALASPGMSIFHSHAPFNLAAQLWISARTFEGLSVFASTFIFTRTIRPKAVFFFYLLAFTLTTLTIFQWQVFPPSYINGSFTTFDIIVKFLFAALLLTSIIRAIQNRIRFPSQRAFLSMIAAYILAIAAGLSFSFYYSTQGFYDFLGHFLKLTSYLLIKSALLEANLHRPYQQLLEINQRLSEEIIQRQASEAQKLRYEQELLKLSKLESIAIVAGGLSHDFKNLLTIILGNADLARMRTDNEQVHNNLKHISDASRQGAELANRLLTFTRDSKPYMQPLDIGSLVQETAKLALSGTKVAAKYSLPGNPTMVEADCNQISQVIHNIVINAIQSMPEGGLISIIVAQQHEEHLPISPGDYAVISIQDQGGGINAEDLDKIFVPFFTTKEEGNGMGLPTSFHIIKNHKGHITTTSELGQGSTFNIYLPIYNPKSLVAEEVAVTYDSEKQD